MADKKITIKDNYVAIAAFLKDAGAPAEMIEFVETRIAQEEKTRETAKAKRLEKNGGEKKEACNSEYYTNLRETIYKVLTTEFQTGDALITASHAVSSKGTPVLPPQVATALKPLIADGTVVCGEVKVSFTDSKGLTKETLRRAYKLA